MSIPTTMSTPIILKILMKMLLKVAETVSLRELRCVTVEPPTVLTLTAIFTAAEKQNVKTTAQAGTLQLVNSIKLINAAVAKEDATVPTSIRSVTEHNGESLLHAAKAEPVTEKVCAVMTVILTAPIHATTDMFTGMTPAERWKRDRKSVV